jgi:hypothetical protein
MAAAVAMDTRPHGYRQASVLGSFADSAARLVLFLCVMPLVHSQNKDLSYIMFEEVPVSSVVGNIAKDSNVSQLLGSDVFSTLR